MTNFSTTSIRNADQSEFELDTEMRAMWLLEPGKFELRQQPIYQLNPDEVLVQMAYCGICPWDVRVYAGKKSVPLPRVMGHEIQDPQGKNVGELDDVALDVDHGQLEFALVNVDKGLLDLDTELVAIPWSDLQTAGDNVRVAMDRADLMDMSFDGDLALLQNRMLHERPTRYGAQGQSVATINGQIMATSMRTVNGEQHLMLEIHTDDGQHMMVDGGQPSATRALSLAKDDRVSIVGMPMMSENDACDFIARSITHAGETLNLSQSAVSRQISALEESLQVLLFHRHARTRTGDDAARHRVDRYWRYQPKKTV